MSHKDCLHTKEPWIDALHAKNLLMATYEKIVKDYGGVFPKHFCESTNTTDYRIGEDLSCLKMSENFSFSGNALQALKAAAPSIPGDSTLTAEHAPLGGANWWWFDKPLEIATTLRSEPVVALQWNFLVRVSSADMKRSRVSEDQIHSILAGERMVKLEIDGDLPFEVKFTAYIQHASSGLILPTTGWRWKGGETLDEMANACGDDQKALYPNEGRWNPEKTVYGIRYLSQFFLAAAVWIQQEIVEAVPQHIERHLAKRIQRERKLAARPTIRIIALRKRRLIENAPTNSPTNSDRHWTCQWVVSGHWRNQPYGPGRSLRKLTYVNPYVKGPEEMPLREVRPKVFAVMR